MLQTNEVKMTPENFVYWLQGFFELSDAAGAANTALTPQQVQAIKNHLQLVMTKVTPAITITAPPDWGSLYCPPQLPSIFPNSTNGGGSGATCTSSPGSGIVVC